VVGPLLTGLDRPLQIASMSATASDIVNLAAITAYDINS
jgi:malate dehydrogenase (oxaloacetate-decarboxylating)(NADP+)